MAGSAFSDTTKIADLAGNLKLKERAWKVIRESATVLEKAAQDRARREREARQALEDAWDHYYNCPNCSVPFRLEDTQCHVCGTARPAAPQQPDPRQQ
jgi:predicted metal-dependent hydrolase